MKTLYKPFGLLSTVLFLGLLLSSCTKKMSYAMHADHLVYAQQMETPTSSPTPLSQAKANTPKAEGPMAENTLPARHRVKTPAAKIKLAVKTRMVAHTLQKKLANLEVRQQKLLTGTFHNRHISAYHQQTKTQSWLGAAVLFLILGLIFFFVGLPHLGSLLWAIGVVLLVVAIVFFILWLVAEAVS